MMTDHTNTGLTVPTPGSESPQSSRHSSEDHDDFVDDIKLNVFKPAVTCGKGATSPTFPTVPYGANRTKCPMNRTQRKPQVIRSISVCEPPDELCVVEFQSERRPRSQSLIATDTIPRTTPNVHVKMSSRQGRFRKLSTHSLGSFGTGYEALMTSKTEVRLTPPESPATGRRPISRQLMSSEQGETETSGDDHMEPPHSPPPTHPDIDGGYAWVVLFGAGLAFFIGGGFGRGFPLVYQQLMSRFGSSATATAWVAAMHGAIKLCSSPIISALCNKLGIRLVVMLGGLVVSAGLVLSAFPQSLGWIYLTYSTIAAIGSNMVHAPSFIMLGRYFDKKKGKAMAIATTCLTLGGVAFAPLIKIFFTEYSYSGAMVLIAGLMLHYCITGALYRAPPSPITHKNSGENTIKPPINEKEERVSHEHQEPGHFLQTISSDDLQRLKRDNNCPDPNLSSKSANNDYDAIATTEHETAKPLHSSLQMETDETNNPPKTSSCRRLLHVTGSGLKILAVYLGLPLLTDPDCVLYGLLMGAAFWAFGISNTFVAGLACEVANMTPGQTAIMLSLTSASDIGCRLLSGVVFDALKDYRTSMFMWLSALGACSTALLPFATSYPMFFAVFAVCSGMKCALHTQHVTVLSNLVGPRKLSSAMGLVRFFQGIGVMIGLAVGGILTDVTGSHFHAFTTGGASLLIMTAVFTSKHFCCVKKEPD